MLRLTFITTLLVLGCCFLYFLELFNMYIPESLFDFFVKFFLCTIVWCYCQVFISSSFCRKMSRPSILSYYMNQSCTEFYREEVRN